MKFDDLQAFAEVARLQNISKAAAKLNYGQSNMTMKIKRLEAYFDTSLFYRTAQGVQLTTKGHVLLEQTNQILRLWEETNTRLRDGEATGSITIGSMETTAAVHLPTMLAQLKETYPHVSIHLKTGPTDELIDRVLRYDIDAAFIAGPIKRSGLNSVPLFRETMMLVTSNALAKQLDASYQQLDTQDMITFRSGCAYRKHLERFFDSLQFVPQRKMELGSLDAILGCVANNMGVSMLPQSVVAHHPSVSSIPLPASFQQIDTHFLYREHEEHPTFSFFKHYSHKEDD
ncbi:LysR family transcriptional regulator [Bacillus sp. Marseille-P3800]|uniref:LysR family transcriptional regulator n=1 Tax=Bacillus sp. Marseille-P3800 TaxID=2014782 RepID=UPI000C06A392|nr:LysR family transcriptional regulator [Bacillus sp. Marseille-P3800]